MLPNRIFKSICAPLGLSYYLLMRKVIRQDNMFSENRNVFDQESECNKLEQDFYSFNRPNRFDIYQEFDEHADPDFEPEKSVHSLDECLNEDIRDLGELTTPTKKKVADFDTAKSDGSSTEIPPKISTAPPALTPLFSASQSMIDEGAEDQKKEKLDMRYMKEWSEMRQMREKSMRQMKEWSEMRQMREEPDKNWRKEKLDKKWRMEKLEMRQMMEKLDKKQMMEKLEEKLQQIISGVKPKKHRLPEVAIPGEKKPKEDQKKHCYVYSFRFIVKEMLTDKYRGYVTRLCIKFGGEDEAQLRVAQLKDFYSERARHSVSLKDLRSYLNYHQHGPEESMWVVKQAFQHFYVWFLRTRYRSHILTSDDIIYKEAYLEAINYLMCLPELKSNRKSKAIQPHSIDVE